MNSIKMGDICYNCPLCCSETFSSKQTLLEHLSNVEQNYYCPVCKNKWSTLVDLIDHLSLDNCQPDNTVHTIVFDTGAQAENDENSIGNSNCSTTQFAHISEAGVNQFTSDTLTSSAKGNEMYVEYLNKDMSKPLHNQELKLIRDPNPDHDSYIIVTQGSTDLESGHTIVTKQNQDGTISLTAVKDMKTENDPLLSSTENDLRTQEESPEELYSCNTCGVSFSSVLEHIQNYHNDQEVVVEEPIDDTLTMEQESLDEDMAVLVRDKQTSRRVITDTGDIVETPVKPITALRQESIELRSSELKDTEGRVYGRRYVQIEKLCDSVIKNIKQDEPGGGPYHKVAQITSGGTKMYQCTICNVCVNTLVEFKSHPCKTLHYKCPHCPVAYHNSKSLCAHMKVHKIKVASSKALVTYECEVCCTVFPTNKSLKLHKRMHDPIKSRPIEPPVANTDGSEVTSDRYLCSICDKLIPLDYRTIHQNSHKTSDKMNCTICNKKFQTVEYLEMHMNVHSSDKVKVSAQDKSLPYNCVFCPRRFARPHEKVKHERIHTGEKPHSCEICGKSFRVSYCLTLHMRTHTGARPYACPHCGKRFKAHSVFNHHLLTHSEVRAYKCPYCPKAFKTSVQLAGHKNSHTKPFSCPHCNRPFASLYAVRVHTETHARQNNLKFKCSLCGASYARAFALKDHVKQQHNKDLDANEHMLGLKEEDWMQINAVSNMKGDLPQEINDLELHTTELIVP